MPTFTSPASWVRPLHARAAGIGLALLIGLGATGITTLPTLQSWRLSALTVAILIGMLVGNAFGAQLPSRLVPGIACAQRDLLRAGVVLYGLRLSFQQVLALGPAALLLDLLIVTSTLLLGTAVGRRLLGLDRDTALLTACGSAICGAAAILAVERLLKPEPSKVTMAVATVVLFGTLDIFLYPQIAHWLAMPEAHYGLYVGATVHEVAQVVAAASASGDAASDTAVIVKLTRVLLLVPVLFALAWQRERDTAADRGGRGRFSVPWFALAFLGMCILNSLLALPAAWRNLLLDLDTLLLATAMAALGLDTRLARLRALGPKPLLLALILFVWLCVGGYAMMRLCVG